VRLGHDWVKNLEFFTVTSFYLKTKLAKSQCTISLGQVNNIATLQRCKLHFQLIILTLHLLQLLLHMSIAAALAFLQYTSLQRTISRHSTSIS
jgi:hypothetical protein